MTIAGLAVGATWATSALRIPARHRGAGSRHRAGARGRLAGRRRAAAVAASTWKCARAPAPTSAAKRPRCWKAWKASAAWCAPAAAAGHLRPVRQAHRDQQRHLAGHGAHHPGGRGLLPRLWRGPLARHPALPAGRQPPHGGLVEKAFGLTLRDLLYGLAAAAPRAGCCARCRLADRWAPTCPESQWDVPLDYEAYARSRP